MSPARTAVLVVALACGAVLLSLVVLQTALDLEAWQRARRRRRAIATDVRTFEKGHQPW